VSVHTQGHTPHSYGRVIGPSQRPMTDKTTLTRDTHAHSEIRTRDPGGNRDPQKGSTRKKHYLSQNFSMKSNINEERTYPGLPINDNGLWRTRYRNELYKLNDQLDIVKVVKTRILRWLGHVFRMKELNPCRKLTLFKPEGTRRVGKHKLRCLESVEEDLKNMGMRNWRRK